MYFVLQSIMKFMKKIRFSFKLMRSNGTCTWEFQKNNVRRKIRKDKIAFQEAFNLFEFFSRCMSKFRETYENLFQTATSQKIALYSFCCNSTAIGKYLKGWENCSNMFIVYRSIKNQKFCHADRFLMTQPLSNHKRILNKRRLKFYRKVNIVHILNRIIYFC